MPLTVSHHFGYFGTLWSSARRDITSLICHIISWYHKIKWSTLWVGALERKSPTCHVWRSLVRSHDLTSPHHYRVTLLYGWNSLTVSHNSANFSGHRHCASGDAFLNYCLTSRDHMFKQFCDFMGGSLTVHHFNIFTGCWSAESGDEIYFIYHVRTPQYVSPLCQVWWPQVLWQCRYF